MQAPGFQMDSWNACFQTTKFLNGSLECILSNHQISKWITGTDGKSKWIPGMQNKWIKMDVAAEGVLPDVAFITIGVLDMCFFCPWG